EHYQREQRRKEKYREHVLRLGDAEIFLSQGTDHQPRDRRADRPKKLLDLVRVTPEICQDHRTRERTAERDQGIADVRIESREIKDKCGRENYCVDDLHLYRSLISIKR